MYLQNNQLNTETEMSLHSWTRDRDMDRRDRPRPSATNNKEEEGVTKINFENQKNIYK